MKNVTLGITLEKVALTIIGLELQLFLYFINISFQLFQFIAECLVLIDQRSSFSQQFVNLCHQFSLFLLESLTLIKQVTYLLA